MTTTATTASGRVRLPRARLYETVRTAHLERAHDLAPASIVYRRRRYDFDDALTAGLDLVEAGPLRAALVLARSDVRQVEVNEPLMVSSLRRTALALAAVDLAAAVRRRPRPQVVTYAIANDPRPPRRPGLRGAARRFVDRALVHHVARRVDRVVFGTAAARDLYRAQAPAVLRARHALVHALPAPCACGPVTVAAPGSVLFVGAFDERKGVPLLLAAWPLVAAARPGARLTLVGTGPLLADVEAVARDRPDVQVVVDPPRAHVHRAQREHAVVVLLSQRTRTWREQVGLPVVEGLAHGCTVVTTDETGLAEWLGDHGHLVVGASAGPQEVADAVVRALDVRRSPAGVLADLPSRDGRLAADAWLFEVGDDSAEGRSPGFTG